MSNITRINKMLFQIENIVLIVINAILAIYNPLDTFSFGHLIIRNVSQIFQIVIALISLISLINSLQFSKTKKSINMYPALEIFNLSIHILLILFIPFLSMGLYLRIKPFYISTSCLLCSKFMLRTLIATLISFIISIHKIIFTKKMRNSGMSQDEDDFKKQIINLSTFILLTNMFIAILSPQLLYLVENDTDFNFPHIFPINCVLSSIIQVVLILFIHKITKENKENKENKESKETKKPNNLKKSMNSMVVFICESLVIITQFITGIILIIVIFKNLISIVSLILIGFGVIASLTLSIRKIYITIRHNKDN